MSETTRRAVIGTAAIGASAALLAACAPAEPTETDSPSSQAASESPSSQASEPNGGAAPGESDVGAVSEVPVGGGKTFTIGEEAVLVTQPRAGEFRAFSAVCTHQGCIIMEVVSSEAQCGCHGARFDGDTGAVLGGPAQRALTRYSARAEADRILVSLA